MEDNSGESGERGLEICFPKHVHFRVARVGCMDKKSERAVCYSSFHWVVLDGCGKILRDKNNTSWRHWSRDIGFFFSFFHLLWFKPWIKQLANLLSTEKYYNVVSPLTFCGNIFDVAIFFSGMKFESDCSGKPLACKMIIDTALTPDSGVKRAGDRKIRKDFEIISIGFVALSRSMAVISTRNCFGKVRFLQTLTGRIYNWFSFTFTT